MRKKIELLLKAKGQAPVINSIDKTISDLKRAGYYYSEVKDTVREFFYGIDGKVDNYIISKGY